MKTKEGFIVHPFETGDSMYHASYGPHYSITKSFKTKKQAKQHLAGKGIKIALYDSPSGAKRIQTMTKTRIKGKPKGIFPLW